VYRIAIGPLWRLLRQSRWIGKLLPHFPGTVRARFGSLFDALGIRAVRTTAASGRAYRPPAQRGNLADPATIPRHDRKRASLCGAGRSGAHGWRKRWDSNPRTACTVAGFQDQFLKPLGHSSIPSRLTEGSSGFARLLPRPVRPSIRAVPAYGENGDLCKGCGLWGFMSAWACASVDPCGVYRNR
jgi:hypothetical protein